MEIQTDSKFNDGIYKFYYIGIRSNLVSVRSCALKNCNTIFNIIIYK